MINLKLNIVINRWRVGGEKNYIEENNQKPSSNLKESLLVKKIKYIQKE